MKFVIVMMFLAACGLEDAVEKADDAFPTPTPVAAVPTPTPEPTPTPVPAEKTLKQFIYFNSVGICNAVAAWDTNTEVIEFPVNPGPSPFSYQFSDGFVYIGPSEGTPDWRRTGTIQIIKDGPLNDPNPECVMTVQSGRLVSIE